ncbi:hypothetical protein N665_0024s0019 [Sinapis alba]|nr:hypothetical protein N665_0024s0019 [Sinapis alba]
MFFFHTEYKKQIKLETRCLIVGIIEMFKALKLEPGNAERRWFEEHPQLCHLFQMKQGSKKNVSNHKVQGMWVLLLHTVDVSKRREVWFIVNDVHIHHRLREHTLISCLNCRNYRLSYKEIGDRKFKVGTRAKDVLYFFQRAVDDLEFHKTFPWGRYSFDYMVKEIFHTMDHFGGLVKEKTLWPLPGFCLRLELLAFETIPKLGMRFRESVERADIDYMRMCQSTFKEIEMRGFPLSRVNRELDRVKRLKEEYSVFFQDMYEEDVSA